MKITKVVLLVALLLSCGVFSASGLGSFVRADSSAKPDEDSKVETEDEVIEEGQAEPGTPEEADVMQPEAVVEILPAPDVETTFLFTEYSEDQIPAGKVVECLIAFHNAASDKSYTVESIQASLRYPMDFSYHLQNYTKRYINKTVEANREATFSYALRTSDYYTGRPFGFVIEVNYLGEENSQFMNTVFNKTITFIEADDSIDAQAILLYLFFATLAGLVLLLAYYAFFTGNKQSGAKKQRIETGTNGVDRGAYLDEWLPAHARNVSAKQSPKPTPKAGKKSKKDE
jgi:translocon-associated protein subunit alpha